MKRSERSELTLQALHASGRVEVGDLASRFDVSEMTVRRDLEELERLGLCRRVHGGAVPSVSRSYEPPFALRMGLAPEAKARIATAVADLLPSGETVMLDTGTTTAAVAQALRGRDNLTILTASLPIASTLADEPGLRVIVLGGLLRPGEHSMVGALTLQAMEQFHVDTCVLGAGGVDADAGLTEFHLEDAAVKRAVVARSGRVVVAADATKLGTVAFATVCPVDRVSTIVTDADPNSTPSVALRDLGVDLVTA
jgi:DeoR/GlpR family transcriptional regulator of sugar metabolism